MHRLSLREKREVLNETWVTDSFGGASHSSYCDVACARPEVGATSLLYHNRDARKPGHAMGGCTSKGMPHAQGSRGYNAVRTKEAMPRAPRPLARERGSPPTAGDRYRFRTSVTL